MTAPSPEQLRLHLQIREAQHGLAAAREDGNYKQIRFWLDRRELLLDRLGQMTKDADAQT